jgi:hypothetical protein
MFSSEPDNVHFPRAPAPQRVIVVPYIVRPPRRAEKSICSSNLRRADIPRLPFHSTSNKSPGLPRFAMLRSITKAVIHVGTVEHAFVAQGVLPLRRPLAPASHDKSPSPPSAIHSDGRPG